MKSATQKRKLISKKQDEFQVFVQDKIMPLFKKWGTHFDTINPSLEDDWNGFNIFITIPYGDRMEPWLKKVIKECYNDALKVIWVAMGAKVNTNAWHNYVFPFVNEIGFIRRGKRPAAYVRYSDGLRYGVFSQGDENTYFTIGNNIHNNIEEEVNNALNREIINLENDEQ